jgi:putative redox protein
MADHKVITRFEGGMRFSSQLDDHTIIIDTPVNDGGTNMGPRPKKLMLSSLAGCTGIDVVGVLNKMRVEFSEFSIDIEADLSEDSPKTYTDVKITYSIKVKEDDRDKVKKAVLLSKEKYCGVSAMFSQFADMDYEIIFL